MEDNKMIIKDIKFTEMNFSQIENFIDFENIKLGIGIISAYFIDEKSDILQLDLQLKIELFNGDNSDPAWLLESKVSSIVEYKSKFNDDDLRQLLPILYLYSKPIIIQMASISNVPLFTLPELDFNDKNIELINMSENDKTDNE